MNSRLLLVPVLLACAATAMAIDPPKRKSGLWEIKMANPDMPEAQGRTMTMQTCVDEKSDDVMRDRTRGMNESCSKNELRQEGGRIVSESVCKMNQSTVTTRAVFTGRFDSAYRADIKSTYDPPMHGRREATSVLEAKWLGACKPGQKPGDVIMPGMPNMQDLMKGMPR